MTQPESPLPSSEGLQLPWAWCSQCHRAYVKGTFRELRFAADRHHRRPWLQRRCPYATCTASTRQSFLWSTVRLWHPDYPEQPERYVIYAS